MNSSISVLMQKQKDELNRLHNILLDELEILKSRDRSFLEKNAELKIQALTEISHIDKAMNEMLTSQTLSIEDKEAAVLHESEVKTLLKACKDQNQVNGHIINSSQIAINRFKNILQKTLSNQSTTYDNKGLTNLSVSSIGVKA